MSVVLILNRFIQNRFFKFSQLIVIVLFTLTVLPVAYSADRPLSLWYFENEGTKIYLLGSIHAMKPDMYPLAEPILNAFYEAEKVVFEVDLAQLDTDETSLLMQQHGMYRFPDSIERDLQPETLALLEAYLVETGVNMDQVKRMKPWYLMLTVGQLELRQLGFESAYGIDQYLQKRAADEGKEILQLETLQEQIEILSGDSMFIQDLSLRASLEERSSVQDDLDMLVEAWQQGAADKMLEMTLVSTARYPELSEQMDSLIYKRNANMVHKIREYADTIGTYLVVVGALHMGGEQGLVHLLSQDYNVTQLSY